MTEDQKSDYPGQQKKIFFQKARSVRSIVGYTEVDEPEYALSFFKLALVFEIYRNVFFALALIDKLRITEQLLYIAKWH